MRDTINLLAENTSIVACYNYTGTPYVKKQMLPEVVYSYGLRESIWNGYLKDADPIGFENVKNEEFLVAVVSKFWEKYGGMTYEGLHPKLAIYAADVDEAVNEVKPTIEKVLSKLGIPLNSILVNVGDSKYTKDEDIRNFNNLDVVGSEGNKKQFIILVEKGKEGWNCRSLFGVALYRSPKSKVFEKVLEVVNKYNQVLYDVIIPKIFHTFYEVKAEMKSEDKKLVLLREPKDAGYYEFSAKDDLVITNKYPGFTPEEKKKSFHADTYCFDSLPEKECFMQYMKSKKVAEVYFTGMFTSNQGDLYVHYYDPESGRIRQYYPDFLAKMEDGTYQLIEVKGDNKIDDKIVKAKAEAAEEMAVASGIEYKMYAGSKIIHTNVLEDQNVISYLDLLHKEKPLMVAEDVTEYGSKKDNI